LLSLNGMQGLLDFAFDPEFTTNKFFYLSFTINLGTDVSELMAPSPNATATVMVVVLASTW